MTQMNLLPAVTGSIIARTEEIATDLTMPYLERLNQCSEHRLLFASEPQVPVAIVTRLIRDNGDTVPEMRASLKVLSRGATSVNKSTMSQAPEDWKAVASLAYAHILDDPLLNFLNMKVFRDAAEDREQWIAYCLPQGVIYMRQRAQMTLACHDTHSFQGLLDDNFRVVATPVESGHARLYQTNLLQDLVAKIIVDESIERTGRDEGARFTLPKITIRIS